MKTVVSIIITTRNEAKHISACLTSIVSQTYENIEVIVVDNHSSDNTKKIARRFTPLVFDAGPERSAQRNFGARKAKGEYLLFLDADMILTPTVIDECLHVVKQQITNNKQLRALVIPEKSIGIGFWARCKTLERACYEGVDWMEAARFYRKKTFEGLGGFDEQLTGPEDFELSQRLRARYGKGAVGRIRNYILHDEGKLTLGELLKRKYYYGKRMGRYSRLPESEKSFAKQSNIFARYALFFRHPEMIICDPVHFIGMIIMKTLEMIALGYGGLRK
jgi:glycosyltransferase involved in cell wall biosynthesis